MKFLNSILLAMLLAMPIALEAAEDMKPVKVEIIEVEGGYQLLRGGEPYHIKGAGLNLGEGDLESFAANGGNSIRNWGTGEAPEILDRAHALGITVALCLGVGSERHDFDYDDQVAVAEQLARLREDVLAFKDHPALLAWIIGNELNFDYTNPRVYDAVNDISKMIHELDPNHPTTTTVAGLDAKVLKDLQERAPDLDFFSFQAYGQLTLLPGFIPAGGVGKPLMITEWGSIGHWEVDQMPWGAPVELDSSEKAEVYFDFPSKYIEPLGKQVIGTYAFLWGWKQEKTPTWFGFFTETGAETEVVDVMHYQWNGEWPKNRAPAIKPIVLDGQGIRNHVTLKPGVTYKASVEVTDPEGDPMTYRWELKPESTAEQVGGDYEERIASLYGLIPDHAARAISITAPAEPGAYRLFVYAYDDHNHAAHANIPFYVSEE